MRRRAVKEESGGAGSLREEARRRLPPVLFLSAALVACALAAGLRSGSGWLVELAILLAVGQGLAAGLALPLFWREGEVPEGKPRPPWRRGEGRSGGRGAEADGPGIVDAPPTVRVLMGAGGRYAVFLASVAFAAVEAHAVGAGLARGAPSAAATLLLPPVIIGAVVLRGALARLPGDASGGQSGAGPTAGARPRDGR